MKAERIQIGDRLYVEASFWNIVLWWMETYCLGAPQMEDAPAEVRTITVLMHKLFARREKINAQGKK
ncbi:MAG: hypothetical protein WC208_14065 [Gallionella sp.]|jgi:hypothetical protein